MIFGIAATVIALVAVAALIYEKYLNSIREKEWALERGRLLALVQTPELAPTILAMTEPSDEPLYVGFDDDVAHDAHVEETAG